MSYYIIIRGPLGCGKSTISKELAKKLNSEYFSIDEIIEKNKLDKDREEGYISQKSFKKANEIIYKTAEKILKKGKPVIFDGNFYWESQIEDLIELLNFPHYIFTLKAPLKVCIERDSKRNKPLGEIAAKVVYKKSTEFDYGTLINVTKPLQDCLTEIISVINKNNLQNFFKSKPDIVSELLSKNKKKLTNSRKIKLISNITKIKFSLPKMAEPIKRTPEHTDSLRTALDSQEHLNERKKILKEISGPNVLELGSGSGSLLRLIGKKVINLKILVGIEFSQHFFNHAAKKLSIIPQKLTTPKNIFILKADITKISIKSKSFNTIILASILHEIKSYYSNKEVKNLLKNIYIGLKKGGKIIIHDGFKRPNEISQMTIKTPKAKKIFKNYLSKTPRPFKYTQKNKVVILPTTDAIEFATKTQFKNWEGELEEEYYPFSLKQYTTILKKCGFYIQKIKTFPEEGTFLNGIDIKDIKNKKDQRLSHNNTMIVAIK